MKSVNTVSYLRFIQAVVLLTDNSTAFSQRKFIKYFNISTRYELGLILAIVTYDLHFKR